MKSTVTFTPEVQMCCALYNNWDYYFTLLVSYEGFNILKNNLASMGMYSYNLPSTDRRGLVSL